MNYTIALFIIILWLIMTLVMVVTIWNYIEIPDNDIPTGQSILDVSLHFIDGTVCEASGYGFEVLTEENARERLIHTEKRTNENIR